MAVEQKVTFCRICEAHCGMVATVEDDRITKLRPDPDHPLSRGYACPKGIAMLETLPVALQELSRLSRALESLAYAALGREGPRLRRRA